MDFVVQTTQTIEHLQPKQEQKALPQESNFKPKPDMMKALEVKNKIIRIWHSIEYKADFDKFLDIILSTLEHREEDYMCAIKTEDKKTLNAYAEVFGVLYNYFIDGYYGDPLGTFYMEHYSHGHNSEYYTPWNVAYMMAQIINPQPHETVCDPCVGSGIMLLAARCIIHENHGWLESSRYGRNLYGMDISNRAVKMAKINFYLTDYIYMICLMQQAVIDVHKQMIPA